MISCIKHDTSGLEDFRKPCFANELSAEAASLHEKAWRPGTQVTYKSCWGKQVSWCNERSFNHVQTSVVNIIEFLTKLFNEGLQYRTINTYRSAISKNHALIEGVQVGRHPLVTTHMRAIINQRIPSSKCEFSWNVDVVLDEILSWGSNSQLDIKFLSWKLVMLVALASAGISSEISYLNCKYMKQQGRIYCLNYQDVQKFVILVQRLEK